MKMIFAWEKHPAKVNAEIMHCAVQIMGAHLTGSALECPILVRVMAQTSVKISWAACLDLEIALDFLDARIMIMKMTALQENVPGILLNAVESLILAILIASNHFANQMKMAVHGQENAQER